MRLEDDGRTVQKRDSRGPDYSGCIGSTVFENGEHKWELKMKGEMRGVWVGVSSPEIRVDRSVSECCPPASVFIRRPDGGVAKTGPLTEGSAKDAGRSRGWRDGETIRMTLDVDAGTLKFFNVSGESECGGYNGITPGTKLVPCVNFDYSTSATIVTCERTGGGSGRVERTAIDAVLSSFARGHFVQTSSRLLAGPTMETH